MFSYPKLTEIIVLYMKIKEIANIKYFTSNGKIEKGNYMFITVLKKEINLSTNN